MDMDFTEKQIKERFDAALRGARTAGAQHKSVTPKRGKAQRAKRKKPAR